MRLCLIFCVRMCVCMGMTDDTILTGKQTKISKAPHIDFRNRDNSDRLDHETKEIQFFRIFFFTHYVRIRVNLNRVLM